jgi:Tfp pilus assembly protein PilF
MGARGSVMKAVMLLSVVAFLVFLPVGRTLAQELGLDYFVSVHGVESERRYLELVETHHLNKVLGFIQEERFEDALAEIKWTLERFPNHPGAFSLLEAVAQLTKVQELPVLYYERAVNAYPEYAITHAQYGRFLVDIGKSERGIISLRHAIRLSPNLIAAHVWLAQSYSKLGNIELARKSAVQARALGYMGELLGEPPITTKKTR